MTRVWEKEGPIKTRAVLSTDDSIVCDACMNIVTFVENDLEGKDVQVLFFSFFFNSKKMLVIIAFVRSLYRKQISFFEYEVLHTYSLRHFLS